MSIAKGSISKLGYHEEATFNVIPVGASGDKYQLLAFSSEGLVETINLVQSDQIRSDRRNSSVRGGNITVNGSISLDFSTTRMRPFLKHLLSASTSTAIAGLAVSGVQGTYYRGQLIKFTNDQYVVVTSGTIGATPSAPSTPVAGQDYTAIGTNGTAVLRYLGASLSLNRFVGGDALPAVGLCFEKQITGGDATKILSYPGSRIGNMSINVPQEGMVKADFSIASMRTEDISADVTEGSGNFFTAAIAEDSFTGSDCSLCLSSTCAAAERPVQTASISVSNGLDESVFCIGSRFRRDIPEGKRVVSGNFTVYFESAAEYDLFKGETETQMAFVMIHAKQLVIIRVPAARFTGAGTPSISGAGVMSASYAFTAFAGSGGSDDIIVDELTIA